jgi:hypothetical protein
MLFEGTAWAQAAAGTPADNPSFVQQLMTGPGPIMALVVAVMYFLVDHRADSGRRRQSNHA